MDMVSLGLGVATSDCGELEHNGVGGCCLWPISFDARVAAYEKAWDNEIFLARFSRGDGRYCGKFV